MKYKLKRLFKYMFQLHKLVNDLLNTKLRFYYINMDVISFYPIMMTNSFIWCGGSIKSLTNKYLEFRKNYYGGYIENYVNEKEYLTHE